MHHPPAKRRGFVSLILVSLAGLLVAAAVAAAPAAAVTPTTLKLSPQSPSIKWGAQGILNGILQTSTVPPQPVDQQQVLVLYSTSSSGPWSTTPDSPITNTAAPYSSGEYTYSWTASRNYYWQMVFEGAGEWGPRTSNVVHVKVVPVIGKPRCPSSVKHRKKFTVYGAVKPHYRSGSKNVKVRAQRYSSGKWKRYRTYTATTRNSGSYSKYSVRLSISKKGKYRFYATIAGTSTLAAGKSAFSRRLRVK